MKDNIVEIFKKLLKSPNLCSKKWIYEQYDSKVMNDTLQTGGDAAIVRIRDTKKAIAMSTDCNPRYVYANPFEGAKQAVAETYRNISAVGATPLAITNCLNFGNPQKPEIMGQIVKAIEGITEACKFLEYPVVSGNVSLYNETNGVAIKPTPAIGGVGLLKDLTLRVDHKFKEIGDVIFLVGKTKGHLDCSIYQYEIEKNKNSKNPPIVDLIEEKNNSEFIRNLISRKIINACHDLSEGGLMIALYEMCGANYGVDLTKIEDLAKKLNISIIELLFGEDQSRYLISLKKENLSLFKDLSSKIEINEIGEVTDGFIKIFDEKLSVNDLNEESDMIFRGKFS